LITPLPLEKYLGLPIVISQFFRIDCSHCIVIKEILSLMQENRSIKDKKIWNSFKQKE
jgi:hypothetical protein